MPCWIISVPKDRLHTWVQYGATRDDAECDYREAISDHGYPKPTHRFIVKRKPGH